jgi:hypothetical protein
MLIIGIGAATPVNCVNLSIETLLTVVAANAGTHLSACEQVEKWIPAFAGTPE